MKDVFRRMFHFHKATSHLASICYTILPQALHVQDKCYDKNLVVKALYGKRRGQLTIVAKIYLRSLQGFWLRLGNAVETRPNQNKQKVTKKID